MPLSQLSPKAQAARMATVIFAPLAVVLACYAPAIANSSADTSNSQGKYEPALSTQPPVFGYLA